MAAPPLIWALDIATVTGIATGRVGETPTAQSVRLAPPGAASNELFQGCFDWWSARLATGPKPDILAIEELLPPTARRGATSTAAQHRLAGLHGIVRALAKHAQIPEIAGVSVLDVRQHFIHSRTLPRDAAKHRVMETCRLLGWHASDSNCGDALALWSFAQALINPARALDVTPLFASWEDVARVRGAKR